MRWWRRLRQWAQQRGRRDRIEPLTPLDALIQRAAQAQFYNQYDDAYAALDDAAQMAKDAHDINKQVEVDLSRADVLVAQGRLDEAEQWLHTLKEDCEARQHMTPVAYALISLGVIAQRRDDWKTAQRHYEQARALADDLPSEGAKGRAAAHLAEVYRHADNAHFATYLLEKALPLLEQSGDHDLLAHFWGRLGAAYHASERWSDAIEATERGLDVARMMDQPRTLFTLYTQLARYAAQRGKYEKARVHLAEAQRYVDFGDAEMLQTLTTELRSASE